MIMLYKLIIKPLFFINWLDEKSKALLVLLVVLSSWMCCHFGWLGIIGLRWSFDSITIEITCILCGFPILVLGFWVYVLLVRIVYLLTLKGEM